MSSNQLLACICGQYTSLHYAAVEINIAIYLGIFYKTRQSCFSIVVCFRYITLGMLLSCE